MRAKQCNHESLNDKKICIHLLEKAAKEESKTLAYKDLYHKLTGKELEYDLICENCYKNYHNIDSYLQLICNECYLKVVGEDGDSPSGICGEPGIKIKESNIHFNHKKVSINGFQSTDLLALEPLYTFEGNKWLGITKHKELINLDFDNCSINKVLEIDNTEIDFNSDICLHISPNNRFIAIANTLGLCGIAIDLSTKQHTIKLKRSNYGNHSKFPLSFFEYKGKQYLVHSDERIKRLDISDPETGQLLTNRELPSWRNEKEPPPHYLDYSHGSLCLSPNQEWIADFGWMWHPIGILRTWNLHKWLEENVWESEDGESLKELFWRDYFWDGPMCWLDNTTLAVWGIGGHGDALIPGVIFFDVVTGNEIGKIIGPKAGEKGSMIFDKYLFSISKEEGTSVWEIATSERLCIDKSLFSANYHKVAKQFLQIENDGAFLISNIID